MINTKASNHLLVRFYELVSKESFDIEALKKGHFPDHEHSR